MQSLKPCVTIVEDDDMVRALYTNLLEEDGYICRSFSSCSDALADIAASPSRPDLILSDIRMKGMNGLEFLREIRNTDRRTPVILISGHYDLPCAMEAIGHGAADYLLKPALAEDLLGAVAKHLRPRGTPAFTPNASEVDFSHVDFSMDLCNLTSRTTGMRLVGFANSLAEKRAETLEHSRRVAAYAVLTGTRIGGVDLRELELGAMLHDIGKVGLPENVLNKSGPLNVDEWRIMRLHPAVGRDLLRSIPGMDGIADIVYSHHENFDGSGYPRGLANQAIPLSARIFAVVDAFDAITSDRPYRPAQSPLVARVEIQRLSGAQFDPAVVEPFLSIPEAEIEGIRRFHSESRPERPRAAEGDHVRAVLSNSSSLLCSTSGLNGF